MRLPLTLGTVLVLTGTAAAQFPTQPLPSAQQQQFPGNQFGGGAIRTIRATV